MNNAYAPTNRFFDGTQSAYSAGLSYFDDHTMAAEPLGVVPVAAIAAPVQSLVSLFNAGSKRDRERQDRVNWILSQAIAGNVNAGRILLAGPANVSGNEKSMWTDAIGKLQVQNASVYNAAQSQGPSPWFPSDTATDYPSMRAYVNSWALTNSPLSTAGNLLASSGAAGAALAGAGISPVVLLGGAAIAAMLLMRKR